MATIELQVVRFNGGDAGVSVFHDDATLRITNIAAHNNGPGTLEFSLGDISESVSAGGMYTADLRLRNLWMIEETRSGGLEDDGVTLDPEISTTLSIADLPFSARWSSR